MSTRENTLGKQSAVAFKYPPARRDETEVSVTVSLKAFSLCVCSPLGEVLWFKLTTRKSVDQEERDRCGWRLRKANGERRNKTKTFNTD